MALLYAEGFAPWCEKARWALDHHRVSYDVAEHVPLLGEVRLRFAARRLVGRVTVPLWIDSERVLMDSFDIARHAERVGTCDSLFPAGRDADVATWNARSDALMIAGRAMLLPRMASSREALREQVPTFLPGSLRPAMIPLTRFAVGYLRRKYDVETADYEQHEAAAREVLDALRATLAERDEVFRDGFSYADISMAAALQFVLPVDQRYIALGPATRQAWTHHGLANEYRDLLAWRDRLYAARRNAR